MGTSLRPPLGCSSVLFVVRERVRVPVLFILRMLLEGLRAMEASVAVSV
jgi:hypothetical protein